MIEIEHPVNSGLRVLHAGDSCVVVEFGNAIDLEISARVHALRREIEKKPFRGFIETVPTYRSLAVCFNPLLAPDGLDSLLLHLAERSGNPASAVEEKRKIVIIPTCYEGQFALDIEKVASNAGISVDEVIRRHSSKDCYCYMLGFSPGQPYFGEMDPSLAIPRLKEPREKIPAGSVAIGGKQTGIYPIESPGGWSIIGRTPLRIFDPLRKPPIFLEAGMWARFSPIDAAEFEAMAPLAARPDWEPDICEETVRKEVA